MLYVTAGNVRRELGWGNGGERADRTEMTGRTESTEG